MKIALFILLIFLFINYCSALIISEIELNPSGDDKGNEWVELYSPSEIDVSNFFLENIKVKRQILNFSFSGYKVISTAYNFLTNDNQKIRLYDPSGSMIDETTEISDAKNDGRTWQFCSEWEFSEASKGSKNNCAEKIIEEESQPKENEKEIIREESKITPRIIESPEVKEQPEEIEEIIQLKIAQKDIKTGKIWKSQTAYIKEYSLAGFALFCLIMLAYLIKKGRT